MKQCTHPDHTPDSSCEDRAVGCSPECACCMGEMAMSGRKYGLYWVRFESTPEDEWVMAKFEDGDWTVFGNDCLFHDSDFTVIGGKIEIL